MRPKKATTPCLQRAAAKLGGVSYDKIMAMHKGTITAQSPEAEKGAEFLIKVLAGKSKIETNNSDLVSHSSDFKIFWEEKDSRRKTKDSENIVKFMVLNKNRGRISRLLIVDDEALFRESIRILINRTESIKEHIEILEAKKSSEAIDILKCTDIDYIIMDIDLGEDNINGYDLTKSMLQDSKNIAVIICSNKREKELDNEIISIKNKNFLGFIQKPMIREDLLQLLALERFYVSSNHLGNFEGKKKQALLLNDDVAVSWAVKLDLKKCGFEVNDTSDYFEALTFFQNNQVDFIISDINLGKNEITGYDFLKEIRKTSTNIPFIFVSAFSKGKEWPKAKINGASGYLQVPFTLEELKSVIKNIYDC